MKLNRREFLKSSSLTAAGLVAFQPVAKALMKATEQLEPVKQDGWYPSVCQGCTTWCPIQLYLQGGRIVKVRGNQHSMVNPGYCCPRGHLIPKMVYDPDRVKVPMKRTNPQKGKGIDPQFVPISWDEAMNMLADKIMELRANNEPHKFMVMRGRYTELNGILYSSLPRIIGSPNNISHSSICAEAEKEGTYFTEGTFGYMDYDLQNCKYLVLWGVDPFRSNRQIPRLIDKFPDLLANTELVTIDPYLTGAANKSKHWLPVIPGEDGALASAMAHYILTAGLWNRVFVGDFNGTGATAFVPGQTIDESHFTENETRGLVKWWNIELKDKSPEWAANICGIPAQKIKQVCHEMTAKAPFACIWYGPGPTMSPRGTYTAMAIHAINGLLGCVDHQGGVITRLSTSLASVPATTDYMDAIANQGITKPKIDQRGTLRLPAISSGTPGAGVVTNNVANALIQGNPYDIKVAIGYWCNFNFSCSEPERWDAAMAQIPFFAHITTHAAEMSQFADLLLPASFHAGERWGIVNSQGNLYAEAGLQQPLTNRYFDARTDETEISYMLAEKLAEKGFPNLLNYFREKFKDPETNQMPNTPEEFELFVTKATSLPRWQSLPGGWQEYLQKGVARRGPFVFKQKWGGNFPTVSKYFEFYSIKLKQALETHANKFGVSVDYVLEQCDYVARGELAFVPHYEPALRYGDPIQYPFLLIDVKSLLNREGRSANHPWYHMFKTLDMEDIKWDDCIKINPQDAARLNITDGMMVRIKSTVGSFMVRARVWEGVQPGTIAKTFGLGHWAYGRFGSNYSSFQPKGVNNNSLMKDAYDRLSGSTCRNGGFMRVKIERV